MTDKLTIGTVSDQAGVPIKTIRFYEEQGILPSPPRSRSGYRLFSPNDVRRLRLIARVRLLGVPLAEAKALADQAFSSSCGDYAARLLDLIQRQRAEIDCRMGEFRALQGDLTELEEHIRHTQIESQPGQRVAECAWCPLLDTEESRS